VGFYTRWRQPLQTKDADCCDCRCFIVSFVLCIVVIVACRCKFDFNACHVVLYLQSELNKLVLIELFVCPDIMYSMYLGWDLPEWSERCASIPKITGSNPSGGSALTFRSDLLLTARDGSSSDRLEPGMGK
jgi:hypothetical protein